MGNYFNKKEEIEAEIPFNYYGTWKFDGYNLE